MTLFFCLNIIGITPCLSEDRIKMEGTSIIGNKELPKMLYIVPWKNSELPEISTPPIKSLVEDALAPIERETFKRQLYNYYVYSKDNEKKE